MAFRGNRPKKKKKNNGLYYPHTREDLKRVGWCLDKNIKIAVVPSGSDWQVEININNKIHLDPKIYEEKEAIEKMYEYYKYYYDKHNI